MIQNQFQPTADQIQAIDHNDGPALVVAGAGTGKTAVITQRIARLILSGKARPEEVLALTFTEKAAAEMQQRVDELLPYGYVDTQIMTFHALAERLLREFALDAGLNPEFQVLNELQQIIIMQEVLAEAKFEYFNPPRDPFAFIAALRQAVSRLKDEGIDSEQYQIRLKKLSALSAEELAPLVELGDIYQVYSRRCQSLGGLDFADLLIKLQQLLQKRRSVKEEIVSRYKYILVDEFQDTNTLQMEIIRLILNKSNNIMVVGDDDQAIYRFRGASVQNILNFRKIFPKIQLIVLKDNFRSGQPILDAGYRLIQNNNPQRLEIKEGIDKKLRAHSHSDAKITAIQYDHKSAEVDEIVEKISSLIKEGVEQKNIAILLRKNNQIKPYLQALQKKKVDYYVHQDVELFEQKSVKTMVALCSAVADLDNSLALFQLLLSGFFKNIDNHLLVEFSVSARKKNTSLYRYIIQSEEQSFKDACALLKEWRGLIGSYSAGELVYAAIKQSGYLEAVLKQAEEDVEAALQIQYLTDFFRVIKQFELVSKTSNLVELNQYLDEIKQASGEVMSEVSPLDTNGVQIMTIHRAKGLEFEYVFIPELTEQTFPTYSRSERIRFPEAILPDQGGDHYQEERRLFYVGLTRAKRFLQLSYALDHGDKRPKRVSRFIGESLDADLIQKSSDTKQSSMGELISSFAKVSQTLRGNALNRLYQGDWLYLTTNQVADYLRSEREFWLFHVLNLPKGPFHTLVYGSAIHTALEHLYKCKMAGRSVENKEIIDIFSSAWQSEGFVSAEHESALFKNGQQSLIRYLKAVKNKKDMPIAIEQPFELQIPKLKTVIVGRYDAVFKTSSGVEIRDFKTSRVKDQKAADKKAQDSIQLGIYALSWEKLQQKPVHCTSLEFIEDLILGANTSIDHEKTVGLINQAVQGIKAGRFDSPGQSSIEFDKLLL